MDVKKQLEWQVKEKCGNRIVKIILERIQILEEKPNKSHETVSSLKINPENKVSQSQSGLLSSDSDPSRSRPQRNKKKTYAHYFDGGNDSGDNEVDIGSGASASGSDSEAEDAADFKFESPLMTITSKSNKTAAPRKISTNPKPQKNDHENRSASLPKPKKPRTRKSPPRVVCRVCNLNIGKYKLKRHFKLKHPKELPKATTTILDKNPRITCDFCPSSFAKNNIWQHLQVKHPERLKKHQEPRKIKCDLCSLLLPVGKLYMHKKTQHAESQVKTVSCLQCDLCPYTCTTEHWLESHILQVHVVDKPSECDICFKSFLTEEILQEHVKRAHEDKNFNCSLCPSRRSFQDPCSLRKHIETVHKVYNGHCVESESRDTNHLCPVCETWFMTESDLVQHLKKPESESVMKCELCSEPVYTPCRLSLHRQKMHSDDPPIVDTSSKRIQPIDRIVENSPDAEITENSASVSAKNSALTNKTFSCAVCSAHFPRRCDLDFHELQEKHHRWKCPICAKLFKSKRKYLKAHMESVHSDARPFPCTLKGCGKEFKQMNQLRKHMAIHDPDRVHCKDCLHYIPKKTFQAHVAKRHEGNRKFVCDVCSKNWGTSVRLRQHMRSHTDERPCPCKFCDAMYKCSAEAQRHMKKCKFWSEDQRQRFAKTSIRVRKSAAWKEKLEKKISGQVETLHGTSIPKANVAALISTNELSPCCGTTSFNGTLIKHELDLSSANKVTLLTDKAVELNKYNTIKSEPIFTNEKNCATSFNGAHVTFIKQELEFKCTAEASADLGDPPEPEPGVNVPKFELVLKQEVSTYSD